MIVESNKTDEPRERTLDLKYIKNGKARAHPPKTEKNKNNLRNIMVCILLVTLASFGFLLIHQNHTSIVPKSISKSVDFPVYYPDAKMLPAGFTFNPKTLSSGNNTVVYSISHGTKKLVVTEQHSPSDQDIQTFYKHQMPIHIQFQTKVGVATIAALNSQNVVSLPTNNRAWLIITYPNDISTPQLHQVLQSFRK